MTAKIQVALIYVAADGRLFHQLMDLPMGSCIRDALMASGWLALAEFEMLKHWLMLTADDAQPQHRAWQVGIFSQKQALSYVLKDGDRVEIYRPLSLDPMKNRQRKLAR